MGFEILCCKRLILVLTLCFYQRASVQEELSPESLENSPATLSTSGDYNSFIDIFRKNWESPMAYLIQRGYIPITEARPDKTSRDAIKKMQKEYGVSENNGNKILNSLQGLAHTNAGKVQSKNKLGRNPFALLEPKNYRRNLVKPAVIKLKCAKVKLKPLANPASSNRICLPPLTIMYPSIYYNQLTRKLTPLTGESKTPCCSTTATCDMDYEEYDGDMKECLEYDGYENDYSPPISTCMMPCAGKKSSCLSPSSTLLNELKTVEGEKLPAEVHDVSAFSEHQSVKNKKLHLNGQADDISSISENSESAKRPDSSGQLNDVSRQQPKISNELEMSKEKMWCLNRQSEESDSSSEGQPLISAKEKKLHSNAHEDDISAFSEHQSIKNKKPHLNVQADDFSSISEDLKPAKRPYSNEQLNDISLISKQQPKISNDLQLSKEKNLCLNGKSKEIDSTSEEQAVISEKEKKLHLNEQEDDISAFSEHQSIKNKKPHLNGQADDISSISEDLKPANRPYSNEQLNDISLISKQQPKISNDLELSKEKILCLNEKSEEIDSISEEQAVISAKDKKLSSDGNLDNVVSISEPQSIISDVSESAKNENHDSSGQPEDISLPSEAQLIRPNQLESEKEKKLILDEQPEEISSISEEKQLITNDVKAAEENKLLSNGQTDGLCVIAEEQPIKNNNAALKLAKMVAKHTVKEYLRNGYNKPKTRKIYDAEEPIAFQYKNRIRRAKHADLLQNVGQSNQNRLGWRSVSQLSAPKDIKLFYQHKDEDFNLKNKQYISESTEKDSKISKMKKSDDERGDSGSISLNAFYVSNEKTEKPLMPEFSDQHFDNIEQSIEPKKQEFIPIPIFQ